MSICWPQETPGHTPQSPGAGFEASPWGSDAKDIKGSKWGRAVLGQDMEGQCLEDVQRTSSPSRKGWEQGRVGGGGTVCTELLRVGVFGVKGGEGQGRRL